jgi:glycerol-1-phosphate dehydrogenase [NAD(P)+]
VDDLAALLSSATVHQFIGRPTRDLQGIRLLATALMLNGVSMAMCGSSRPASGAEHLISHALDNVAQRPRPHGLQVGVAAYLVSRLQDDNAETDCPCVREDRLLGRHSQRSLFTARVVAGGRTSAGGQTGPIHPCYRPGECRAEVALLIDRDESLRGCFVD